MNSFEIMKAPAGGELVNSAEFEAQQKAMEQLLHDNLGTGLVATDLIRIRVPAGGGKSWTVATLEGEESTKELVGVVVAWRDARAFWYTSFDESGGGALPDCYSDDSIVGHGQPAAEAGGMCANCKYSQFGSAPKGEGQACRQSRQLLLLTEGNMLPYLVTLPATSIRPARQYFMKLAGQKAHYWAVETRLTLESDKSGAGIIYSKAVLSFAGKLPQEGLLQARAYHNFFKQLFSTITVSAQDYAQS